MSTNYKTDQELHNGTSSNLRVSGLTDILTRLMQLLLFYMMTAAVANIYVSTNHKTDQELHNGTTSNLRVSGFRGILTWLIQLMLF